jgi:transposase
METRDTLEEIFRNIWPRLTERERRLFAASEARKRGYGGISLVSAICGLSRATISKGLRELDGPPIPDNRVRRPGAGRPNLVKSDPEITELLEARLSGHAQAPPEAPAGEGAHAPPGRGGALSWTLKSTRTLARELSEAKHPISYVKVGQILKELGYSLKGNKKTGKERSRAESEAQYSLIDREAADARSRGMPVLHLESRSARGEGFDAGAARTERGRADPGAFAAGLALGWWEGEGRDLYPGAPGSVVTVYDSPGGLLSGEEAGAALSRLAAAVGAPVRVFFFPAGTHRWNYPSREIFSFLTGPERPAGPRRSVVRCRLIAPAGPSAGWAARSYVLEPGGSAAAAVREGAPGQAQRSQKPGGQESLGFEVKP